MPNKSQIDFATRQQVYLERLKSGQIENLDAGFESLRGRIRGLFAKLETNNLRDISRAQVNRLILEMREAQTGILLGQMNDIIEQMPEIAGYSAGYEVVNLEANITPVPRFNAPTAELAYKAALQNPVQATGELLEPFTKSWVAGDAARVSNVVRTGWAQGKTIQEMTRQLVGTKAGGYTDGALAITRRNAETVIRTTTQHVANAARQKVWEDNGDIVKGYKWLSTLDRKTSVQCRSLDGREFKPGQGPMPPIHPNCRSTTIAVLDKKYDFLKQGQTRSAEFGPVSAKQDFYNWLKDQNEKDQAMAIGSIRAKLLRDGGLTPERFSALNLDRNFQPLTLYGSPGVLGMQDFEPEAFKRAGLYREK